MAWLELKFQVQADHAESISEILEHDGALAVTLQDAGDQPIYEPNIEEPPPIWNDVIVTGLFDATKDTNKILALILNSFTTSKHEIKYLEDKEWERAWMEDFKPMQFGHRLWIIPSHHHQPPESSHVILDPGLAFGTGKHPTTALCLKWLDQNIKGGEIALDYGCGSGILGIAALKLGAKKIFAIDHDQQALNSTNENATRNHINEHDLETFLPDDILPAQQMDIVLANILANPLIQLADHIGAFVKAHGFLILSGILEEQVDDVITAYQPKFQVKNIEHLEDWARVDLQKT